MKKQAFLLLFMAIFSLAGFSQVVVKQSSGLMAEPSLTSKRLSTAIEGEQVNLIEKSGEFWKIVYNKKTGFIHESCLSNYVNPNKKELEKAGAEKAEIEKTATGNAVVIPGVQDSAMIVTGPRNRLFYKGRVLKAPELKALLITNPEAKEKWETRNFLYITGMVLAGTGGGIVGGSLGGGNLNMVFLGLGVAGVGIACGALSDKVLRKAVSLYNLGIAGKQGSISLSLGMAEHGYGLTLRF